MNQTTDLAGVGVWDSIWRREKGRRINLLSYYDDRLSRLFRRFLKPNSKILEAGCGGSVWLPFFGKYLGCEIWGVDYSPEGVELAQDILKDEGVQGRIVYGDAFHNKILPQDYFDAVWSYGLIEHFNDVGGAVEGLVSYLRPGGVMITLVPNLHGLVGRLHKLADKEIYDAHIRISPLEMDSFHRQAGLEPVLSARHFGVFSVGVVNFNRLREKLPRAMDRVVWAGVLGFQQAVCLPFRLLNMHPESSMFSPYVIGVYRRPGLPG